MKYGFVVPVYNHGSTLEIVVKALSTHDVPIIVVDDGNDEVNKKFISDVGQKYSQVVIVTREKNGGKGKAMSDGVRKAHEIGLSHVLQIDSDGQHTYEDMMKCLAEFLQHPDSLVLGVRTFEKILKNC